MKGLLAALRTLLLFGWVTALKNLIAVIAQLVRRSRALWKLSVRDRRAMRGHCFPLDLPAFVRPDPLLYSQYDLMKRGLAVTWDNPDIQLMRNGAPVSSSRLDPDAEYEIVARIWNSSPDAPVVDMPVQFSFLEFGVGTVRHDIGTTAVTVGVKGGPDHPAYAVMPWRTPATAGHYCIQVLLEPFDDSNRDNNLGQENTSVGEARSPAVFTFTLRNDTRRDRRYSFEADAYTIGWPPPCSPRTGSALARLARHRYGAHPLPPGWTVEYSPLAPSVASGAAVAVEVTVTPPVGFVGSQVINVNVFHDGRVLAGGVTLTVEVP